MNFEELILIINQCANAITSIATIIAVPLASIIWAVKKWKKAPHLTKDQKTEIKKVHQALKQRMLEEKKGE